jgi:hypothetical protein
MTSSRMGCVGTRERILRIVLAVVLLGFALACPYARSLGPVVVWLSGIAGAVLLVTGVIARCPIYRLLGLRTG